MSDGDDRFKVLVPLTLHTPEAEAVLVDSGQIDLIYALEPEERVYGGGALGLAAQRRKAVETTWERIGEMDAVCALPGPRFITPELLDRAPHLRVVFITGAGFDSIDVDAATERGVVVVNARGNNAISVSEQTVGLMLSLVRRIAISDRVAHREQRPPHMSQLGGFPPVVADKTIGLVGFGRIGRAVGRICALALGMRVLAHDPYPPAPDEVDFAFELVPELDDLLAAADVVSVHSPLTDETHHLIGAAELAAMKDTAYLINTSRGPTVDGDALVAALAAGEIAGAGLDVTEPEPLPAGHPLFELDTVILTPHSAGASPELVRAAGLMATGSTLAALRGEPPETLVNPDVWPAYRQRWFDDPGDDDGHR